MRIVDAPATGTVPSEGTFIAGSTQVVDLMGLGVLAPDTLVDLRAMEGMRAIERTGDGLHIGALATMAEVCAHPDAQSHPALVQSLVKAASPQIRTMATIGGNLLQRTRCTYFRDGTSACNKRALSTGCAAIDGDRHGLAILGTSAHCIANYPGDLAVALVALDASVDVRAVDGGERTIAIEDLHRSPGDTPHVETVLEPGDLITTVTIPERGWTGSTYVKVRERASYAFALASCAVALRLGRDGRVSDARIALGGIATTPWRAEAAEGALVGRVPDPDAARAAGEAALEGAERALMGHVPDPDIAAVASEAALDGAMSDAAHVSRVDIAKRTVARAVLAAADR